MQECLEKQKSLTIGSRMAYLALLKLPPFLPQLSKANLLQDLSVLYLCLSRVLKSRVGEPFPQRSSDQCSSWMRNSSQSPRGRVLPRSEPQLFSKRLGYV